MIFESSVKDKRPLDLMSEIKCHREISPLLPEDRASSTPGLQSWCYSYWANQAVFSSINKIEIACFLNKDNNKIFINNLKLSSLSKCGDIFYRSSSWCNVLLIRTIHICHKWKCNLNILSQPFSILYASVNMENFTMMKWKFY